MSDGTIKKPYLVRLSGTIKHLQRTCIELLNDTKYFSDQVTSGSSIVEDFAKLYLTENKQEGVCKPTEDEVVTILLRALEEISSDATKVATEIDRFEQLLLEGEKSLMKNRGDVPFMSEVWFGDTYDASKIDGFKKLKEEIQGVVDNIDEEYVINYALKIVDKVYE